MIAVIDVTTVYVQGDMDYFEIRHDGPSPIEINIDGIVPEDESEIERIFARAFVDVNGHMSYIGWSKKVQKEIGLPFEAFTNLENHINKALISLDKVHRRNSKLIRELEVYKNMSFWQRIKYCCGMKLFS